MAPRPGFGGFDKVSKLYPENILTNPVCETDERGGKERERKGGMSMRVYSINMQNLFELKQETI